MSVVYEHSPVQLQQTQEEQRKRTSSFSLPAPAKLQRTSMTSSLRRTESLIQVIPTSESTTTTTASNGQQKEPLPYYRTLEYYKDQRLKRKALLNKEPAAAQSWVPSSSVSFAAALRRSQGQGQQPQQSAASLAPIILSTPSPTYTHGTPPTSPKPKPKRLPPSSLSSPSPSLPSLSTTSISTNNTTNNNKQRKPKRPPCQIILPSASSPITILVTSRTSSPLSPTPPTPLPGRPVFPRSRAEPDLYKKAIKQRMGTSSEGRKILHMGPRLALGIMNATRELERIVAGQMGGGGEGEGDGEGDVVMGDCTSGNGGNANAGLAGPVLTNSWVLVRGDDWEMVDCAA